MHKRTVYYVTFTAPGAFVAESWKREVSSPDPHKVEWPGNAYAFTMHKREDAIDGDTVYIGQPQQIGPTYYHPDSKVETLAEVRLNQKATPILISNMECNRWSHIIWSRWGNWPQPFDPAESEVLAHGVKTCGEGQQ